MPRKSDSGAADSAPTSTPPAPRSAAAVVGAGILASRLVGFLRVRVIAYFFGVGPFADVLQAGFRAPNLLQVLLGEGTLSAAFIPIYARLEEEGRREDAGRFAGAIFALLVVVTSLLVGLGVLLAEPLVSVFTPGFLGDAAAVAAGEASIDRFPLAVRAVRILFPMTGLLVLSAWALGVLNSHRRFFVSYFAPVVWNAAIITALLWAGRGMLPQSASVSTPFGELEALLYAACFGGLIGGALQFAVQLPLVLRLLRGFRLSLSLKVPGVREAIRAFGPVLAGRGVVQVGGYLDLILASLLAAGAVAALGPALYLYMLPVSLFGMSVAAAELPELARAAGASTDTDGPPPPQVAGRVSGGLRQVAFLTVPTAVGYLAFGLLLVGALYRTGRFGVEDSWLVYLVLCGYSLGLVATTASRLLQNTFYALRDTRTPARVAAFRVGMAALLAVPLMLILDRIPVAEAVGFVVPVGFEGRLRLGAAGLSLASGVAAWLELWLLRRALRRSLPRLEFPVRRVAAFFGVALAAGAPAAALWWWLPPLHPAIAGAAVVGLYGALYLLAAHLLHLSEAERWLGRLRRR